VRGSGIYTKTRPASLADVTKILEPPHPQPLVGDAPAMLRAAVLELIEAQGLGVDIVPDAGAISGAKA